jgi:plastocyanin
MTIKKFIYLFIIVVAVLGIIADLGLISIAREINAQEDIQAFGVERLQPQNLYVDHPGTGEIQPGDTVAFTPSDPAVAAETDVDVARIASVEMVDGKVVYVTMREDGTTWDPYAVSFDQMVGRKIDENEIPAFTRMVFNLSDKVAAAPVQSGILLLPMLLLIIMSAYNIRLLSMREQGNNQ